MKKSIRFVVALVGIAATSALVLAMTAPANARAASVLTAQHSRLVKETTTTTTTYPNAFPGGLYVDPNSAAAREVTLLEASGDTTSAALIGQLSSQSQAIWLGDWNSLSNLATILPAYVSDARAKGKTLTFVTYAIPGRDCGSYSAGGLSASDYLTWNKTIAQYLAGSGAAVIVEPDSLAMLTQPACAAYTSSRPALLKSVVGILKNAGLTAYLDAGNSHWVAASTMAKLLKSAGVSNARGFSTNVSNFYPTSDEVAYADTLSSLIGGKHYVIDVSRNGNGWQGTWCNPSGAALGQNPAVADGTTRLDALLWVKTAGESDGTCNGGPAAGTWWESYAIGLVTARGL